MLKLTGKKFTALAAAALATLQPLSQQLSLRQTRSPWQLNWYRQAQLM